MGKFRLLILAAILFAMGINLWLNIFEFTYLDQVYGTILIVLGILTITNKFLKINKSDPYFKKTSHTAISMILGTLVTLAGVMMIALSQFSLTSADQLYRIYVFYIVGAGFMFYLYLIYRQEKKMHNFARNHTYR